MNHMLHLYFQHDWNIICDIVTACSFLINFTPNDRRLARWPWSHYPWIRNIYLFLLDMLAFCALNWRKHLPSLDAIEADNIKDEAK